MRSLTWLTMGCLVVLGGLIAPQLVQADPPPNATAGMFPGYPLWSIVGPPTYSRPLMVVDFLVQVNTPGYDYGYFDVIANAVSLPGGGLSTGSSGDINIIGTMGGQGGCNLLFQMGTTQRITVSVILYDVTGEEIGIIDIGTETWYITEYGPVALIDGNG